MRIPVAGPWITDKEVEYVSDAVRNGWYEKAGWYQQRFERAAAEYLGVRFAVALPSCTSAIHLALLALEVGPGDEVIVPDLTWIGSSAPINYVGARPMFADVDSRTWCLDPDAFEQCINPRTKAVIPVDLYGGMPDMGRIREVAENAGIAIIEDAAEALGSELDGQKAGTFGDIGVFSFHGSKTVVTGEGGMLVTNKKDLFEQVLFLRDHGRRPGDKSFRNEKVAFKYAMSGVQAALGLAQMERVGELVDRKRQIFGWYREELEMIPGLRMNHEGPGVLNSYWMSTVVLSPELGIRKEQLVESMGHEGIDCRPFFYPLSSIPAYEDLEAAKSARGRNLVSYEISPYGVNLPSALSLRRDQVHQVCEVFRNLVNPASRK